MSTFQERAEKHGQSNDFLRMSWVIMEERVLFTNWQNLPIQGTLMEGETSMEHPPSKMRLTERFPPGKDLQRFIPDLKKYNHRYWSTAIAFREAILHPEQKLSQLMIEAQQSEIAFKITFEDNNIQKIPFSIDESGSTVDVVKRLEESMYEGQIACFVMAEFLANRD